MRGDRFLIFREYRSVCKIWLKSYGTIYQDRKNCLRLSSLDYPPSFRDPCFNLSIIGFTKMNKHLVENFLAFRNSQGRSRDAKDDQEDSPGDEPQIKSRDEGL
ncbi:hypothetical protein F2Q70_00004188 [Brassica cretica]|uniref:Uncharacterized protein n=1 Tax=Brassica cretica TaxID=69181 RepID=A0A8S9J258_BRACR|nr:hypothetical protein F2Q70_00004188 [Brassica cretica]